MDRSLRSKKGDDLDQMSTYKIPAKTLATVRDALAFIYQQLLDQLTSSIHFRRIPRRYMKAANVRAEGLAMLLAFGLIRRRKPPCPECNLLTGH